MEITLRKNGELLEFKVKEQEIKISGIPTYKKYHIKIKIDNLEADVIYDEKEYQKLLENIMKQITKF